MNEIAEWSWRAFHYGFTFGLFAGAGAFIAGYHFERWREIRRKQAAPPATAQTVAEGGE